MLEIPIGPVSSEEAAFVSVPYCAVLPDTHRPPVSYLEQALAGTLYPAPPSPLRQNAGQPIHVLGLHMTALT